MVIAPLGKVLYQDLVNARYALPDNFLQAERLVLTAQLANFQAKKA